MVGDADSNLNSALVPELVMHVRSRKAIHLILYPRVLYLSSQKLKMIESRFQVEVFAIEPSPGFDFAIFNNRLFRLNVFQL